MDEMKLKLSTKFMKGLVSKLISMALRKKFGCKVDIKLHDLNVEFIDGETRVFTSLEANVNSEEFMKIIKEVGLED